jgi:ribosome-binding protein aMBF1 (putative translation factor)
VANKTHRLSVDGKRCTKSRIPPRPFSQSNSVASISVSTLCFRVSDPANGTAASQLRAAERAETRARVENHHVLEKMRSHGQTVRAISHDYRAKVEAARQNRNLSQEGKAGELRRLDK